jgi:hypothetical protein
MIGTTGVHAIRAPVELSTLQTLADTTVADLVEDRRSREDRSP